jgi:propanol-preferring alcohol dehydrogenase
MRAAVVRKFREREVFKLHVSGRTRVVLERRELEQVNECFAEVLAGAVPARLVFDLR